MPSPPRICDFGNDAEIARDTLDRVQAMGFDHVAAHSNSIPALLRERRSLGTVANINLTETDSTDPLVQAHPQWFALRHSNGVLGPVDPRDPPAPAQALARFDRAPEAFEALWRENLDRLVGSGVRGLCLANPHRVPATVLSSLLGRIRTRAPDVLLIADIAGLMRRELEGLAGAGFDYCLSSLPWWNFRSAWLAEEFECASAVGRVLSRIDAQGKSSPAQCRERHARLAIAAIAGSGLWMRLRFVDDADLEEKDCDDLEQSVRRVAALVGTEPIIAAGGTLRFGIDASGAVVLTRSPAHAAAGAREALIAVINPDPVVALEAKRICVGDWRMECLLPGDDDRCLAPHSVRLYRAARRKPVETRPAVKAQQAAKSPRIVIADIAPSVEGGRFAVKRIVGDMLTVEADVFVDGHPLLAAELLHRAADEDQWQRTPMRALGNDRWRSDFRLDRVGRHVFCIEAWVDLYGGFLHDLVKKRDAGHDIAADLEEGRALLAAAGVETDWPGNSIEEKAALLLSPSTIEAVYRREARAFPVRSAAHAVDADRAAAAFAGWYELFPRSQTSDLRRHGTLKDVIARLPQIRAMGFDVLYLPPIHPIGTTNRKGRNNALTAEPGDPGSVYAIGSDRGGHDAVHPELGTLEDFRALAGAARDHGLEIALDFAVQCSPDHPWLRQHPGWFDWRRDGSIKYAENPPKVYEDIVNVDFYAKDAIPGLWNALRDVVLFWAREGVRIFRVDNPHTKPFAFWHWMIESVRAENPDVIFLSEAFTRPKIMYHLAKLGFSQSYTYFTWRNTKQELTGYIEELNGAEIAQFFRPNFFVNTPDINPYFLQTGGRPGFLIRAALAATLSGLWGVYSGFELCEAAALPGREEYLDSEKYEIKPRNWSAPGNIVAEITALNRLRKAEPALQSHLGVTFYNAFNPNVLYYGKKAKGEDSRILVAVSLNPHAAEGADVEIPLWEWGMPDHGAMAAHDLLCGARFVWHGKRQHLHLTPDAPYRIWKIQPAEDQP